MIKVLYNGRYPNACRGTLIITVNDKEIYNKRGCCTSSGSVWFDAEWDEHVECGRLTWDDANEFSVEIQSAVSDVLDKIDVCCGGCV
jgi:hypothetical protein